MKAGSHRSPSRAAPSGRGPTTTRWPRILTHQLEDVHRGDYYRWDWPTSPTGRHPATGYPQLSAEHILEADPDLIFIADTQCCGQSAGRWGRPGRASASRS